MMAIRVHNASHSSILMRDNRETRDNFKKKEKKKLQQNHLFVSKYTYGKIKDFVNAVLAI